MATASPTPMPLGPVRRSSQRQALRRPLSRPAINMSSAHSAPAPVPVHRDQSRQYNDDSSEDEIPVPMKLSALTKALLNDDDDDAAAPAHAGGRPPSPPRTRQRAGALNASSSSSASASAPEERRHLRSGSSGAQAAAAAARSREISPARKRVVRLSNTPQSLNQMGAGATRRSTSTSRGTVRNRPPSRQDSRDKSVEERADAPSRPDVNTPNQAGRVVRIVTGSSGKHNRVGSSGPSSGRSNFDRSVADKSAVENEHDQSEAPDTIARNAQPIGSGSISRYPGTATRTRPDENGNLQSSMRIKRVGKIPGSFLSGPARRGRRRQSEEDEDANVEGEPMMPGQEPESHPAEQQPAASSFFADDIRNFNSGSPVGGSAARAIHRRHASNGEIRIGSARSPSKESQPEPEVEKAEAIESDPPFPRIKIPSALDQENIPANHKWARPSVDAILDKSHKRQVSADLGVQKAASPERKPLAPRDHNTPHRPAPPPPPKMSVLDAATSKAGAATTTQAKQRRNVLKVNGKCYTRLDCLGRGGSAKVYRVTAENGNMLALKRVSLENADEATIKGYRGEIDLLSKLANVERVINLFDYELNDEKQVLTLLMEMGELDLHTLVRSRQNAETAKFDPVFVRFYWKEMLECLQSVHQHDIVHQDLKPANFVLVHGRLKLIDFGIANAIQTDETINVHRETQVGTPNYMSPESLLDSNNPRGGRMPGRPKLMKLGKPSDVWSLGCILYQMVYGVLPFGHIANQMARCQAIINWDHAIEFPSRAVGGVLVPPSLIRTMKRCLNRDLHMRPTCEELLHDTDPFLFPSEFKEKALPVDEELLGRIIQSVVTRCRERMPTEAESTSVWPQAYWTSVRKAMAARM